MIISEEAPQFFIFQRDAASDLIKKFWRALEENLQIKLLL